MNDRFKFRVWDKESQKYHNGMEVFDYMRGVLSPDKYVMEQCTGLKDRNGKLIYEGDVVCVEGYNHPVRWNVDSAYFEVDDYGQIAYLNYNDLEVIGNIHENKELLDD